MTEHREQQLRTLLRRLRQRVFDDPRIEDRNLIQKVKDHLGIHEGLSKASIARREEYINMMWM